MAVEVVVSSFPSSDVIRDFPHKESDVISRQKCCEPTTDRRSWTTNREGQEAPREEDERFLFGRSLFN